MLSAARRTIWQRSASLSDHLRRVTQIAGTSSSSGSPSARAAACYREQRPPIYLLHDPANRVRQFSTIAHERHLYLVLDDHERGFSVHKLEDIDNDDDLLDAGGSADNPRRLSEPPVTRLGTAGIGPCLQFAGLGSPIIATCTGATLTLDTTKTDAEFSVSKLCPALGRTFDGYVVAIAVGNKRLYVFDSDTDNHSHTDGMHYFPGGLHCLAADPKDDEGDWPWRPLPNSPYLSWSWTDYPPEFPFFAGSITGHVVHLRTGTILVPAWGHSGWYGRCTRLKERGTYSYGTRGGGQWRRRGDWVLPFSGPGYYDHVLGAWVGLHGSYLCACPVMSGRQPPKWKVGKEKLFLENPQWRHVDAKIIHMAERGRYCLVERLRPEAEVEGAADKTKYVLRLTTFGVKYGEDGELMTMDHRPARFYKAPSYRYRFDIQAF